MNSTEQKPTSQTKREPLFWLGFDRKRVAVFDFSPPEDQRHVYKHVVYDLAPQWSEFWREFYGSVDFAQQRDQLRQLGCKGYKDQERDQDKHGKGCPHYEECGRVLNSLCATYRRLMLAAIRHGAKTPRHTHNQPKPIQKKLGGIKWVPPTNYFVSDDGILVETYEESMGKKRGEISLKTAYRVMPHKWVPATKGEFVRAALEEVLYNKRLVNQYCTEEHWVASLKEHQREDKPLGTQLGSLLAPALSGKGSQAR